MNNLMADALREAADIVERFDPDKYSMISAMWGVQIQAFTIEDYQKGSKLLGGTRYKMTASGTPYLRRILYGTDKQWPYFAVDLMAPSDMRCEKVATGEKKKVQKVIQTAEVEEEVYEWRCPSISVAR